MNMAISDEGYDDLADMLAYFGHQSVPSKPLAVLELPAPEPPACEEMELTPSSIPLGWTSIRRPIFDFESVLDFPEPVPDFEQPDTEPDLFQDKIDRLVDVAKIGSREERDEFRQLLADYPVYTSRVEIQRQIEEGLSPKQIRLNARIRRRFESVALEFCQHDLWGPKFAYNRPRLSWLLADQFRRAHLTSRAQLFNFFYQLNERFQQSPTLRATFYSMTNLASSTLPARYCIGGVDFGPLEYRLSKERLAKAGICQSWRWQGPYIKTNPRSGLPLKEHIFKSIRDCSTPSTFVPYKRKRSNSFVDLVYAHEYVTMLLLIEGPISAVYLETRLHAVLLGAGLQSISLYTILERCPEKFKRVGSDLWYCTDFPRPGRKPRIPSDDECPTLLRASVYDVGLGFHTLKSTRSDLEEHQLELAFLRLWRSDESQLGLLRNILKSYSYYYPKDAKPQ